MNLCYGCMTEKLNNENQCPHCGYINGTDAGEHYYLPEGTMLANRYEIGKVLGHGGFGITYIGLDTRLKIRIAVKEYLPSNTATRALGETTVTSFSGEKREQYEYGLKRFLDEATSLAMYNNFPCIVTTTDFFEENNTAYMVMEYLDGIPLNEYLNRKGGKISWDDAMEIITPIMDALKEVHKSGMIHRDISPDNIFITKTGQIKLLDFGAARFALGEKSKSLSVVLKPGYAPPEQYTSNGKQGEWTDVYALAATIYRMVEGVKPPDSMDRVMNDEIRFSDNIGENQIQVLSSALKVNHNDRFPNVESFSSSLYKLVVKLNESQEIYEIPDFLKNRQSEKANIQEFKSYDPNKLEVPDFLKDRDSSDYEDLTEYEEEQEEMLVKDDEVIGKIQFVSIVIIVTSIMLIIGYVNSLPEDYGLFEAWAQYGFGGYLIASILVTVYCERLLEGNIKRTFIVTYIIFLIIIIASSVTMFLGKAIDGDIFMIEALVIIFCCVMILLYLYLQDNIFRIITYLISNVAYLYFIVGVVIPNNPEYNGLSHLRNSSIVFFIISISIILLSSLYIENLQKRLYINIEADYEEI